MRIKKNDLVKRIEALENTSVEKVVKPNEESQSNDGKLRILVFWNDPMKKWTAVVEQCVPEYRMGSYPGYRSEYVDRWVAMDKNMLWNSITFRFHSLDRREAIENALRSVKKYEKARKKSAERERVRKMIDSVPTEGVIYLDS